MQITLYNTCPIEYEKKLKQIERLVPLPARRGGKTIQQEEILESLTHKNHCSKINDTRAYSYGVRNKAACKACPFWDDGKSPVSGRWDSDTTMKIKIS